MITEENLKKYVTIGIASKNRWNALKNTLAKIQEFGLRGMRVLIFDDHSDQPCPFDIQSFDLDIRVERFTESQGYIARRNQLAEQIETPYYLSLDDDSYPASGSLKEAVAYAEKGPSCLGLSFPVYNPLSGRAQNVSRNRSPYPVRAFFGCAHMLNRKRFLETGKYREELVHQGEEKDLAVRAFQKGFSCYHFPDFKVFHEESNEGRSWSRMDFYGSRNTVLWNDWYVPARYQWIKQMRAASSIILNSILVWRRTAPIKGLWAGYNALPEYRQNRMRMSDTDYRRWQKLDQS